MTALSPVFVPLDVPECVPLIVDVPVTARVGVAEPLNVTPLTLVGVIAPSVKVIAGVVVAVATEPETPFAPTTETVVTVPVPDTAGWTGCGSGFGAHGPMLAQRLLGRLVATRADCVPTGEAVLRLAMPVFAAGGGKNAADAVPLYLRDKVALKKEEQ